jgi:hypothetical protein
LCSIIGHIFDMGREMFENLDTGVVDYFLDMLLNFMKVDESGFCVVYMLLAQRLNKKKGRDCVPHHV